MLSNRCNLSNKYKLNKLQNKKVNQLCKSLRASERMKKMT